jgi:hypothetical protein
MRRYPFNKWSVNIEKKGTIMTGKKKMSEDSLMLGRQKTIINET